MLGRHSLGTQPSAVTLSGELGSAAESMVGQRIGNFVITALLGSGGMASVYLAVHPQIDRLVAIKVLAPQLLQRDGLSDRFLVEARVIAMIDHPCIVEIYDYGRLPDGRPFYVMEFLVGQELSHQTNGRRLSLGQIHRRLELICAGLQAIHDAGIIHRDLKPENIIILEKRPLSLKLIDFGLARDLSANASIFTTQQGVTMGSPLYVSPEQAAGERHLIGPRTDLYSLGVILYWLLSGSPPFFAESAGRLLSMHISSPPRPLQQVNPSLPQRITEVVERCLEKDPQHRPASADELLHDFTQAVRARSEALERPAAPARPAELTSPLPARSETLDKVAVTRQALLSVDEAVAVMRCTDSLEELVTALATGALNVLQSVRIYLRQGGALVGLLEMEGGTVRTHAVRQQRLLLDGPSVLAGLLAGRSVFIGPVPSERDDSISFIAPATTTCQLVIFPVVLQQRITIILVGCHESRRSEHDLGATIARLSIEGAIALSRWPVLGTAEMAGVWPSSLMTGATLV